MTDHIVKSFDSELERLYGEITRMGEIATTQLDAAIDVMLRRDTRAAERVVANDEAIDALEHEVSTDVLRLLALRQPMARDLREVYAALRISSDILPSLSPPRLRRKASASSTNSRTLGQE